MLKNVLMKILNALIKLSKIIIVESYLEEKLKNILYVLIDDKLEPIYGCVQGGHAVAQWLLNHPNQKWNNNYLIYLSAKIEYWKDKLRFLDIDFTQFNEPDLDNRTTALAVFGNDKLFKKLKLIALP